MEDESSCELRVVSATVEMLKGSPLPTEKLVVADVNQTGEWLDFINHNKEKSFPFGLFDKDTGNDSILSISF